MTLLALPLVLLGCQEYALREPDKVPPADPPGLVDEGFGSPPNWQDCLTGYLGTYSNLGVEHADVEPAIDEVPADDPTSLDWWDERSFQRFDPALDFGSNWWPVDDGLAADPAYFSVKWIAWLRAWDSTDIEISLGSGGDSWVLLDNEIVAAQPGVHPFEPEVVVIPVGSGQYPLEVRYAHRGGDSGFRLRVLSGDVSICYPEFNEDE
jgi:hypothetical protein